MSMRAGDAVRVGWAASITSTKNYETESFCKLVKFWTPEILMLFIVVVADYKDQFCLK